MDKGIMARLVAIPIWVRLSASLSALLIGRYLSEATSSFTSGPTLCLFRGLTDLPCPFCGTTRSLGSILLGDFNQAVAFNILGFLVLPILISIALVPGTWSRLAERIAKSWWLLRESQRYLIILAGISLPWSVNLFRIL